MHKILNLKSYMLLLFFVMVLTMTGVTYVLAAYGQAGILLIVLALVVIMVGLALGRIAALALVLVLYFIIGSAFFFVALPSNIMVPLEIPSLYLLIWMLAVLFLALLSGGIGDRSTGIYQEQRSLRTQLTTLVATDVVTGFDNGERLLFELEAEFNRSRRYGHTFTLLMFKMQNFTQFQQLYGADEERRLLHHISEKVFEHTRKSDQRFRVSDDTFAVLLTDTSIEHVPIIEKKIDENIRTFRLKNNKLVTITFEYGASEFEESMESYEELYESTKEQVEGNVA